MVVAPTTIITAVTSPIAPIVSAIIPSPVVSPPVFVAILRNIDRSNGNINRSIAVPGAAR
jgi:hypothetical protein